MANNWPSDEAPGTENFDSDSDSVTGTGNARDDLVILINRVQEILDSVDNGASVYSTQNEGDIAFKNRSNNFGAQVQIINSYLITYADHSSSERIHRIYSNTNEASGRVWDVRIGPVSNQYYMLRNSTGANKFQISPSALPVKADASGLKVNDKLLQTVPDTYNISQSFSSAKVFDWVHNRGKRPDIVNVYLTLKSGQTDGGYVVGDYISLQNNLSESDSGSGPQFGGGHIIHLNSFNTIRVAYAHSSFFLTRTGSSGFTPVVSKWNIEVDLKWL